MSFTAADLYEIAKIIFPNSMNYATSHEFHNEPKRQYIVIAAIHEFAKGDGFFKVFGNYPMPAYTPASIWTLLSMLGKSVVPATFETRLKSNHILRLFVKKRFEPWWISPSTYVP